MARLLEDALRGTVHQGQVGSFHALPGSNRYPDEYRIVMDRQRLDPLLRLVADEVVSDVLLADPDLRWLYHPYDGGIDVAVSSTSERDAVRERHRDWLSAHPTGL